SVESRLEVAPPAQSGSPSLPTDKKCGHSDMDSIPPATTISDSPVSTACAANATAFNPDPHTLLIVIAATRGSQPPFSAAWRAGFCPSPACTTLPRIASSICFGSMPARRAASATTLPPSSGAENPARPPWNFPMGVRTADKITQVSISASGRVKHHYSELRNSPLHATVLRSAALYCSSADGP